MYIVFVFRKIICIFLGSFVIKIKDLSASVSYIGLMTFVPLSYEV